MSRELMRKIISKGAELAIRSELGKSTHIKKFSALLLERLIESTESEKIVYKVKVFFKKRGRENALYNFKRLNHRIIFKNVSKEGAGKF